MELLLNILWLLLAVAAVWWLHKLESAQRLERFGRLRCFLLLGCVLVLLFPVISATDDLHAIRSEMEESNPSKRTVRQAGDKSPAATVHSVGPLALSAPAAEVFGTFEVCGQVNAISTALPQQLFLNELTARAPPLSHLG
jgi:hypothetical protein